MLKTKLVLFFYILLNLVSSSLYSKNKGEERDSILFNQYIDQFRANQSLATNELLLKTAYFFINNPYVANTLESGVGNERLTTNLHEFDCNTFVETCIALVLTLKSDNQTFPNFKDKLRLIRYRDGEIKGYQSRLHYVTDWAKNNKDKNILIPMSKELGGSKVAKNINFMTNNYQLYNNLCPNKASFIELQKVEREISNNGNYIVIDKKEINNISDKIRDGDIVAFATSTDDLDYSHIAIACHTSHGLSFIHASTNTMSVIEEPQSLLSYCSRLKKCTGISIFRLNNIY